MNATLTPGEGGEPGVIRAFAAAAAQGRAALAAHLQISADTDTFYPTAYGAAVSHLGALLDIYDGRPGGGS